MSYTLYNLLSYGFLAVYFLIVIFSKWGLDKIARFDKQEFPVKCDIARYCFRALIWTLAIRSFAEIMASYFVLENNSDIVSKIIGCLISCGLVVVGNLILTGFYALLEKMAIKRHNRNNKNKKEG